jgi:hypothetical protein
VGLVWEKEIYIFGNLQRTGYRDDDNWAGMITIVKLGPENKEQTSVNNAL